MSDSTKQMSQPRREQQIVRPLYPSADYESFVEHQKAKGLIKSAWPDLVQMWQDELAFRREFEECLNGPNEKAQQPRERQ